jgi:PTH1 family peptidyl-tRNA hydrolase
VRVVVIMGLGNPGERYRRTRHNAGFMVVDELLARAPSSGRWNDENICSVATVALGGQEVLLAKPQTFMNRSGYAAAWLLESRGLTPADLIVVFDDMALDLGTLRVRERGTHGGHNGVRSIIDQLGTDEFARIRIGIREDSVPEDLAGYVLSDFSPEEVLVVQESVGAAADAAEVALQEGVVTAMNRFNTPRKQTG